MKIIFQGCAGILTVLLMQGLAGLAATFTADTTINFTNLNYEGTDIVVTNCTLTVEGSHTFASLQLQTGARLTQTQTDNGLRFVSITISNESHVLNATNLVTLDNTNVATASPIVVRDPSGTITYSNGVDYVLITNVDGSISTGRTPGSTIPDGGTVLVSYSALLLLGPTGVNLTVTGDVLVNSNSTVNVDGMGYGAGFGPGPGTTLGGTGSGGGHGGYGGYGGTSASNAPGGVAFDSNTQPADKGCGGGAGLSGPGGAGGGAIKLSIGGLLRVDGLITANGRNGTNNHSGGGAGGSIWLSATTITGAGSITADGGAGEPTLGGGGGGGCVALYFGTNTFTGLIEARGGNGPVYGGAGTIYSKSAAQPFGSFVADNNGHHGTNTLLSTAEAFDVLVKGGAVLSLTSTQTIGSLVLASNGWVSCVNQWLNVLNDATIRAGGGIIAEATGFSGGQGVGDRRNFYGYYTAGGGGYGGFGAASIEGPVGGIFYGSILQPSDRGSGGGNVSNPTFPSGVGGGAVLLTVGNTLNIDGRISAEGGRGLGQGGGGGSGGSIWITTSNIVGSGMISANGGGTDGLGGGGSGGRIAIYFQSNIFNGPTTAFGGVGGNVGGAGTIYIRDLHQSVGRLLVDNGDHAGANTPLNPQQAVDLVAERGAIITPSGGWILKSLTVLSNAYLVVSNSLVTISGDASIGSGCGIIADGTGFGPSSGPGSGRTINVGGGGGGGSTLAGSGASHGGFGGQNSPGFVYDSVSAPSQMGSGGGTAGSPNFGGTGGGAMNFTVAGNLFVDGRISANGITATNQNSGGGSGGSIALNVGTLSGSGLISANGGGGAGLGGGGGGGRISISYNTNAFVGNLRAFGGSSTPYVGGAGSIYLKNKTQSIGQIVIDNSGTIGAGTDISSGGSPVNLTLTGGGALWGPSTSPPLFQNVTIESNSFYYPSNSLTITVLGNATVRGGGGIIADGAGSPANSGTGAGRFGLAGSGGGYGGFGASGSNSVTGGITYGIAAQPVTFGSGGGGFSPNVGGAGGGAARVSVTGTLALDGKISADGRPGTGLGGGGAGGSVWLSAGNFTGSGIVSANGGSGSATGAGGGGGGRIAITTSPGTNGFVGIITAFGGSGFSRGGAGSIYTRFGVQNVGQILVDNGGVTGTNTTVTDQNLDVTIRNGGSLGLTSSSSMHNLVISSNGWLTIANLPITVTGSATIQAGGGILADGNSIGSGQGAGRGSTSGLRGGGGYGGWGAANPSPFGIAYGSLQSPTDTGSIGGSGSGTAPGLGGAGGGAIHLTITQNLAVDGRISANGNPGGLNSGGGSGGSVWLQVGGTFSGAGLISANGGSGDPNFGGGGGGGRISLSYANNLFTGAVSTFGGGGVAKGGAGTIYFKANNQNPGLAVVDNGGIIGTNTGIGTINSANFDLTLKAGAWLIASSIFPQTHNVTIGSNAAFAFPSSSAPLTVSGDLIVHPGGAITADGKGLGGGFGPGVGGSVNQPGFGITGGGGGHGGLGASSVAGAAGGINYDLVSGPSQAGSGGGNGAPGPSAGGSGGGIIPLNVVGTLVLNGAMTANGVQSLSSGGGGGAGGSINLTVGTLSGSGIISAKGGPGNGFGGGGGGGRIAIHYGVNSFTGSLMANGGLSTPAGGAGTIYIQKTNDPAATVMVDNGGNIGTNTPLDLSQQVMLTVRNGAVAHAATGYLLLSNLVIGAGGKVTTAPGQTNGDVAVLGNATIQFDGEFSLDGLGYGQTNGPGAGTTVNGVGSGGGYGGNGGASSQSQGGGTYGSASQPIDRGSGGGGAGSNGSQGGGALHLTVGGALTVDGLVTANGASGFWDDSGGGSGGSVWISAGSIYGSGGIMANGGDGEMFNGGGGGGGRVAVYSGSNSFAGPYSVLGGKGFTDGQNGSLYFSSNYPTPVVISQTPVGTVTDAVGAVTLLFNTPLNSGVVSPANFQLTTPGGPLPQSNVVVSALGTSGLRFSFPLHTLVGNYTFTFGPQIGDIFGKPMSQVYTGAFSISLPVVEGFVTDTNGQPVPGVVLQGNGGFSATTGSNGEYALGVVGPGNILTPIKPGYMFVPAYRSYNQVITSISNENYLAVATIAPDVAAELRGTDFVMHWAGISGVTYQFFFSTNLIDWESSLPLIPGTNGPMQFSIPIFSDNPTYYPIRFYRLNAKNY